MLTSSSFFSSFFSSLTRSVRTLSLENIRNSTNSAGAAADPAAAPPPLETAAAPPPDGTEASLEDPSEISVLISLPSNSERSFDSLSSSASILWVVRLLKSGRRIFLEAKYWPYGGQNTFDIICGWRRVAASCEKEVANIHLYENQNCSWCCSWTYAAIYFILWYRNISQILVWARLTLLLSFRIGLIYVLRGLQPNLSDIRSQ